MSILNRIGTFADRLLGHGDRPLPVSLPLGAWAVAAVSDALASATGEPVYDAAARYAIEVGLAGSVASMVTGAIERRSAGVKAEGHVAEVAAHAGGALLVGGLYAASLALRLRSHSDGVRPTGLARALSSLGGGVALTNAVLVHRLAPHPQGRARLDPASPLGLRAAARHG